MSNLKNPPNVVPKRKVVRLAGQQIGEKESLSKDIDTQSTADLEFMLREITIEETAQQIKLDNPPTRSIVDNRENKPLKYVRRKTETQFGSALDKAVIKAVERSLAKAITKTTDVETGKLSSIRSQWNWIFIPAGAGKGATGKPINPLRLKAFPQGARLILMPKLDYVGIVNQYVHASDGKGFMAMAVAPLKRSTLLKNYSISVGFTNRFKIKSKIIDKQGTPFISITARRKTRSKRRK